MNDLNALVERLANECGLDRREGDVGGFTVGYYLVSDMKFRTLILKVAEECAKVCEEQRDVFLNECTHRTFHEDIIDGDEAADRCSAAIRARFTPSDTAPSPQPEPPAT